MDYILSLSFLIHILISITILYMSMSLGKILMSYVSGYQPLAGLFDSENGNIGFNAIYRILFTPVAIVGVAVVAYSIKWDKLVNHLWLISIYVFILQLILISVLSRWRLINKVKLFVFQGMAIAISYYIYTAAISKGLPSLLPDEESLRTEMWLIISLFLYGVLKNMSDNVNGTVFRKKNYIQARAAKFRKKYRYVLNNYDEIMSDMLIAIMIYEDFNRPKIARGLEKIKASQTRHIMQYHGAKNDEDSIKFTAISILPSYEAFRDGAFNNDWERRNSLLGIFRLHNPEDPNYADRVSEIYDIMTKPY